MGMRMNLKKLCKFSWITGYAVFSLTLMGCNSLLGEGAYQGVLIEALPNTLQSLDLNPQHETQVGPLSQRHVSVVITKVAKSRYQFDVLNLNQGSILQVYLESKGRGEFQVELPTLFTGPLILKKNKVVPNSYPGVHWNCASGTSAEGRWVRVCRTADRLLFQVLASENGTLLLDLSGVYGAEPIPSGVEAPMDLTREEAINLGMGQNFKHLIHVKQTLQAVHRARGELLNLLPQADGQALFIFAATSLNPFAIAAFAGSFVPFIFPSKWLKVFESRNLTDFERTGLHIARLNLVNDIEKSIFILKSDKRFLNYAVNELDEAKAFFEELAKIPEKFLFASRFSHVIAAQRLDVAKLRQVIYLDRMALSLALGMQSPLGVRRVHVSDDPSKDLIATDNLIQERGYGNLSAFRVSDEAIHRSLELRQMDYFVKGVSLRKRALYYNWMDPRLDANQAFSFSFAANLRAGRLAVEEAEVKRTEQVAIIKGNVYQAVTQYNTAAQVFQIAQAEVSYQTARLERLKGQTMSGTPGVEFDISYLELKDSLKSKLDYYGKLEGSLATLWVARANIRRMLLSDVYSQSYPLMPNQSPWQDCFDDAEFKRTSEDEFWEADHFRPELDPLPTVPVFVRPSRPPSLDLSTSHF
jgi:hypothetical protein